QPQEDDDALALGQPAERGVEGAGDRVAVLRLRLGLAHELERDDLRPSPLPRLVDEPPPSHGVEPAERRRRGAGRPLELLRGAREDLLRDVLGVGVRPGASTDEAEDLLVVPPHRVGCRAVHPAEESTIRARPWGPKAFGYLHALGPQAAAKR